MRDDPKLKLSKAVSLGFFALLVNVANGPKADNPLGKDPRVRQAFDLAIDREALNQVVFNGEFVPGNQWVNPQSPWYQKDFPVPKRDIAKAKALMKEAGVTGRLTIDFMVGNNPETRQVAEVLQSMAAEAGFDLKIRVVEAATGAQGRRGRRLPALREQLERPHRSRRQHGALPDLRLAAEHRPLLRQGDRRVAPRGARLHRLRHPQEGLREDRRQVPAQRLDDLSLPSQLPDRPHRAAGRLQALSRTA